MTRIDADISERYWGKNKYLYQVARSVTFVVCWCKIKGNLATRRGNYCQSLFVTKIHFIATMIHFNCTLIGNLGSLFAFLVSLIKVYLQHNETCCVDSCFIYSFFFHPTLMHFELVWSSGDWAPQNRSYLVPLSRPTLPWACRGCLAELNSDKSCPSTCMTCLYTIIII